MRYVERPYAERRFVMVVDDDRGTDNEMIDVFQRTHIPAGITFGSEGYMKNTLYVAHPASVGLYVPYERHERIFIEHKMHELAYLCQALGATELKITRIKGLNIDQSMKSSFSAGADASYAGKFGAQADYSSSSNRQESTTNASSISISVKSDAMLLPFVPDDLMWYKFEPTWKQMVSQRKVGALEYTLEISSKDHSDLSTSQSESLKASMKILLLKCLVPIIVLSKKCSPGKRKLYGVSRLSLGRCLIIEYRKELHIREANISTHPNHQKPLMITGSPA